MRGPASSKGRDGGRWIWTRGAGLAFVYLLGSTAFPSLHLAFHEIEHDHEGGGIRYHLGERDEDEDDDHGHEHDQDHHRNQDHEQGHDGDQDADHHHHDHHDDRGHEGEHEGEHGDESLAHFQSAMGDGTPAGVELVPLGPSFETAPLAAPEPPHARRDARAPAARAPPGSLGSFLSL